MLQNARVIAFTVSELLRENQQGGGDKIKNSTPKLGLRVCFVKFNKVISKNLKNEINKKQPFMTYIGKSSFKCDSIRTPASTRSKRMMTHKFYFFLLA